MFSLVMKYASVPFCSSLLKNQPFGFRKAAFSSGISCQVKPGGGGGTSTAAMVCTENVTKRVSRASTSFVMSSFSSLMFLGGQQPTGGIKDNKGPYRRAGG